MKYFRGIYKNNMYVFFITLEAEQYKSLEEYAAYCLKCDISDIQFEREWPKQNGLFPLVIMDTENENI